MAGASVVLVAGCAKVDPRWDRQASEEPTEQISAELAARRMEVAQDPKSSEARVRVAKEYLKLDRLRDAAEEFQKAIEIDPQNADAVMGMWEVAARLNDVTGAIDLARRMEQVNPNDPRSLVTLGEAAQAFEQALALRPRDPWLLLNAALCEARMRRWERAESYTRRAAALAPDAVMPRLMLGSLYLNQGMLEQAATELESLVELQPNNALVREALGRTRRALGEFEDALGEFAAAQRLRPEWVVPYLNAADTYLRMGQYDSAEQLFKKALQVSPMSFAAALGLVEAYAGQGKVDRAIEATQQMLDNFPDHPIALNNLAFLLGQKKQNLDYALTVAQRLAAAYPGNAMMENTLGWVYHRASRQPEAIIHLQRAVQLSPSTGLFHFHLGQALQAAGRRADAATSFRNALALGLPSIEKGQAEKTLASM